MECEFLPCCRFFEEKMKELPKAAEYIQNRICRNNHESCSRARIYRGFGREHVPPDLDPDDLKEARRIIECLKIKAQKGEIPC